MTADLGIGANTAIESAIVLCNILQYETKNNPNRHFTNSELSTLFTEYQDKRYERAKKFIAISGGITRMRSYESIWKRIFIARIVTLPVFQRYQAKKMMLAFAKSPKLAYVPTQTINDDADGWKMANEANSPSSVVWVLYALITSFIGAALSYLALSQWGAPLLHIS
jgi:FAD dependent monooxygenase